MKQSIAKKIIYAALCCALPFAFGLLAGCGSKGSAGASAPTTGTVTGTVTTAVGEVPLAGVSVSTTPTVGAPATTDSGGHYTLVLPAGSYTVTYSLADYTTVTAPASVTAGASTQTNASMAEAASGKPSVAVTAGQNVGYGQDFTVTASATSPVGATLTYSWTGTKAASTTNTATATSVTLAAAFGGTGAPGDPGYVAAYPQETRFGLLPISDDTRGQKTVSVTVSDTQGGSTSASVTVFSAGVQGGVKAVALGVPVYMNSGVANDAATVWNPVTTPTGTTALSTAGTGTRNPWFVPDVLGKYIVSTGTGSTVTIYAGTYAGAVQDGGYTTKTVSGVTYTNFPTVTPDKGCMFCHDGSTAPDNFTPWAQTAHATFFATGLEGITSNNGTCVKCHTVGYDQSAAAANGGFDDMATASGFVYTKGVGAWAAMWANYPTAARVSNIQCENCHGPQNTGGSYPAGAHKSTANDPTAPGAERISYGAEVCAQCHMSGTGHHIVSEWLTLDPDTGYGHSNKETAIAEGMSTSCGRCHSAQGYLLQLAQLNAGNIGSLPSASIDWDASNVQPQTCTACHDPHDDANPNLLRVSGSTPLLPSGFAAAGLGKGALCVTCHNSRNGAQTGSSTLTYLHEDGETYNGGDPTGYSAPHQACQADVLMGRNAYFMGSSLPMLSKHANAEDSCVACHLRLNPQTHSSHGGTAVSTHVMYIRDQDKATLCANCHGSVNGEALVASVESQLEALAAKMGEALKSKLNGGGIYVTAYDSATDTYTAKAGFAVTAGSVASVTLDEIHGQIGFDVTLSAPASIAFTGGTKNTATFGVRLGDIFNDAAGTTNTYLKSGNMVRAGWNYFLVEGDNSKGIHNPGFVQGVLNATLLQDLSN